MIDLDIFVAGSYVSKSNICGCGVFFDDGYSADYSGVLRNCYSLLDATLLSIDKALKIITNKKTKGDGKFYHIWTDNFEVYNLINNKEMTSQSENLLKSIHELMDVIRRRHSDVEMRYCKKIYHDGTQIANELAFHGLVKEDL